MNAQLVRQYEGNVDYALVCASERDAKERSAPVTVSRALYNAWQDGVLSTTEYEAQLRKQRKGHHAY
jgi:hypothetical protein